MNRRDDTDPGTGANLEVQDARYEPRDNVLKHHHERCRFVLHWGQEAFWRLAIFLAGAWAAGGEVDASEAMAAAFDGCPDVVCPECPDCPSHTFICPPWPDGTPTTPISQESPR